MADFSANWSASDRPVFPYNSGTEHGLKRHKHQKIEQGKGYNMV